MSSGALTRRPVDRGGVAFSGLRAAPVVVRAVVALTALGAVLRFMGIGHQGFWFDEANTVLLVHLSPGRMLGLIPHSESTPPLYYCVAWVWVRVFGDGEAGLRSLSALAGVAVIPVAYAAAAALSTRRTGVIVAALAACNPLLIWYSQEARSYELLVLLTGLALLAFAHARRRPSGRALTAWGVAGALALATHYYAVLAIAPQAVWLAAAHRRDRRVMTAVVVVALCGLALIPLALSQNATGHDSWIGHSPLGIRLGQIIPQFLIGTGAPAARLLTAMAVVLAGGALVAGALAGTVARRGPALTGGALALAGFLLSLALVAAGHDALITRNLIALWLPAAIAVAAGVSALAQRGARAAPAAAVAITAALCTIGVTAVVGVAADRSLQRPDWRPVAAMLGSGPPAGTVRIILIQHYRDLLPLSLYVRHLAFLPAPGESRVGEIDVIAISSPRQALCWWGAACNLTSSRLQAVYPIPGFHELWRRRVLQFTIMRLVSDGPWPVARGAVAAALTATSLHRDDLLIQRS